MFSFLLVLCLVQGNPYAFPNGFTPPPPPIPACPNDVDGSPDRLCVSHVYIGYYGEVAQAVENAFNAYEHIVDISKIHMMQIERRFTACIHTATTPQSVLNCYVAQQQEIHAERLDFLAATQLLEFYFRLSQHAALQHFHAEAEYCCF